MSLTLNENVLEYINNLIVVLNNKGEAEYINSAAQRILGYSPNDLLGDEWWNKIRFEQEYSYGLKKLFISYLQGKNTVESGFERALKSADGQTKYLLWNVVKSPENKLIAIGQDITKQKEAEQNLRVQQKELQDSIEYAKNIQEAILPDLSFLSNLIYDYFVFYKPKDIVSGDFYWAFQKDDILFVSAIDCTGHGVPGAMMSVLANSILREIIIKKGMDDLTEIFSYLDNELLYALSKQSTRNVKADGMDLGVLKLNLRSLQGEYMGANRPMFLIPEQGKLIEIKGSPYPIGYFHGIEKRFNKTTFQLKNGDSIYLFSDGFTDQFGGEKNKKFSKKRFKELLTSMSDMTMTEQKSFLDYVLNNWKQDEPQTDDIVVFGLKI